MTYRASTGGCLNLLILMLMFMISTPEMLRDHDERRFKGSVSKSTFHVPRRDAGSLIAYDLVEFEVEEMGEVRVNRLELTCPGRTYNSFQRLSKRRFQIQNPTVSSRVASIGSSMSRSGTFHLVSNNVKSTVACNSCILRLQSEGKDILINFSVLSSSNSFLSSDETTRSYFLKYIHHLKPENETTSCIPIPQNLKTDENSMSMIEEKMNLGHRLKTKFILGGLMGMLSPILDPIMEAVNPMLGGVFGAILGPGFQGSMGQQMGPEFADLVPRLLTDEFMATLPPSLIGPVSEAVSASLGESLIASLRSYLTHGMTERVSSELVPKLFRTLIREIPPEINAKTSSGIAERVTVTLTHILVRSLTHSVAPALVHTITHNPMQDYYCYYCYHHGVYCSYCHYAPLQVYYTQYYSAFYSAYYADYYSKFVGKSNQ